MTDNAIQDAMPINHCYGCGPANPAGLKLKSYWSSNELTRATFCPDDHFSAGAAHFVNGGVLATLLDCHGVTTAMADAYRRQGRSMDAEPPLFFATSRLEVDYLRPTPLGVVLHLEGRVESAEEQQVMVIATLSANDKICAQALVTAVPVPLSWMEPA